MTQTCEQHTMEPAAGTCDECGYGYCEPCLVYARGPKRPPFCMNCALSLAGIRAGGRTARKTWRERRKLAKIERQVAKIAAAPPPAPLDPDGPETFDADAPAWWSEHEESTWTELAG